MRCRVPMFLASSSWRTISTSKIRKKFNGLTNLTVYFGIYFRGSCENLVFFITAANAVEG